MVEWAGADYDLGTALRLYRVEYRSLGVRHRGGAGGVGILWGLRIHALVHAPAQAAAHRAVGHFLSAERPPFAASPLHAQKFQCGAPARGSLPRHADVARQDA